MSDPAPAPSNGTPVIGLTTGSISAWHGVDRFAQLAAKIPDVRFRLILPDRLGIKIVPADRVEVVRVRSRSQFHAALATLDAAVGSLALERAGLSEAAPLKVRDYVNAGIPTALPYGDTNLGDCEDPMLLHLAADPSQWAKALAEWLSGVTGGRLREETRQAVSIDTIEARRLELLRSSA